MMVTKEFARDHGLSLPEGYDRKGKSRDQLSLYEKAQQEKTGITKEERIAQVSDAWQRSDSAKAFVQALGELGYVLATGKRPYVLVDIYGDINALPKLIGDKSVRTKDISTFLEKEFPAEGLPTVEEARTLASQHRKAREAFVKTQLDREAIKSLENRQAERREQAVKALIKVKAHHAALKVKMASRHSDEMNALEACLKNDLQKLKRKNIGKQHAGKVQEK